MIEDKRIIDLTPWSGVAEPSVWDALCSLSSNNLTVSTVIEDNKMHPIIITGGENDKFIVVGNFMRYINLMKLYDNGMIDADVSCKVIDFDEHEQKLAIKRIKSSLITELVGVDRSCISSELIRYVTVKLHANTLGILQGSAKSAAGSNPSAAKQNVQKYLSFSDNRSINDIVSGKTIEDYRELIGNTVFGPWVVKQSKNTSKRQKSSKKRTANDSQNIIPQKSTQEKLTLL